MRIPRQFFIVRFKGLRENLASLHLMCPWPLLGEVETIGLYAVAAVGMEEIVCSHTWVGQCS